MGPVHMNSQSRCGKQPGPLGESPLARARADAVLTPRRYILTMPARL
jgi:hypothetical protein